jgi:hypothetical protein
VDRLKAALDLEAKARSAMAEGLAQAKVERDRLVSDARTMAEALVVCERWLRCRCSRPEGMDYRDECPRCSKESPRVDLLRGMSAAAHYLPDECPAIRAEDLVEARTTWSLLSYLSDLRFALGDDGRRMQDELLEYCRDLRRAKDVVQAALGNGADEAAWEPGEHWADAAARKIKEARGAQC